MQDVGNNAQDLFHAPLGLVHKLKFEFNSIFSTEVRNEFNIPTFENGKNYSIRFEISNNSPIFDSIRVCLKNDRTTGQAGEGHYKRVNEQLRSPEHNYDDRTGDVTAHKCVEGRRHIPESN